MANEISKLNDYELRDNTARANHEKTIANYLHTVLVFATLPAASDTNLTLVDGMIALCTTDDYFYKYDSTNGWEKADERLFDDATMDSKNILFQYTSMPSAVASLEGRVLQYVGETTGDYTSGAFYKCVLLDNGEYDWVNQLQKTEIDTALSTTSENPVQNKVVTSAINSKIPIVDALPDDNADYSLVVLSTDGHTYKYDTDTEEWIDCTPTVTIPDMSVYSKNLVTDKQSSITEADIEKYDTFDTQDEVGEGTLVFGDVTATDLNPITGKQLWEYTAPRYFFISNLTSIGNDSVVLYIGMGSSRTSISASRDNDYFEFGEDRGSYYIALKHPCMEGIYHIGFYDGDTIIEGYGGIINVCVGSADICTMSTPQSGVTLNVYVNGSSSGGYSIMFEFSSTPSALDIISFTKVG